MASRFVALQRLFVCLHTLVFLGTAHGSENSEKDGFLHPPFFPDLYVGEASKELFASLSTAPSSELIVTPISECVYFSPPKLIFGVGETQAGFSISADEAHEEGCSISYVISGVDHVHFHAPPSDTVHVFAGDVRIVPRILKELEGEEDFSMLELPRSSFSWSSSVPDDSISFEEDPSIFLSLFSTTLLSSGSFSSSSVVPQSDSMFVPSVPVSSEKSSFSSFSSFRPVDPCISSASHVDSGILSEDPDPSRVSSVDARSDSIFVPSIPVSLEPTPSFESFGPSFSQSAFSAASSSMLSDSMFVPSLPESKFDPSLDSAFSAASSSMVSDSMFVPSLPESEFDPSLSFSVSDSFSFCQTPSEFIRDSSMSSMIENAFMTISPTNGAEMGGDQVMVTLVDSDLTDSSEFPAIIFGDVEGTVLKMDVFRFDKDGDSYRDTVVKLTVLTPPQDGGFLATVTVLTPTQEFTTTFTYDPLPTITSVSPDVIGDSTAEFVSVIVTDLQESMSGDGADIVVMFDETQVAVQSYQVTEGVTTLTVLSPVLVVTGEEVMELSVYNMFSPRLVGTYLVTFFDDAPRVSSVVPSSGLASSAYGGLDNIVLELLNIPGDVALADLGLTCGANDLSGAVVSVDSSTPSEFFTVTVSLPLLPVGVSTCVLTYGEPGEVDVPLEFEFEFLGLDLVSSSPEEGVTRGGTLVEVVIDNFPVTDLSDLTAVTAVFHQVTVGGVVEDATVNAVSIVESTSESTTLIISTPEVEVAGEVEVTVYPTLDATPFVSFTFVYLPMPVITKTSPTSATILEETEITVEIIDFPLVSDVNDIRVLWLDTVAGDLVSLFLSEDSTTYTMTVTVPATIDTVGEVKLSIFLASDPTRVAETLFTFTAAPKLDFLSPDSGFQSGGEAVIIQFSYVGTEPDLVEVVFKNTPQDVVVVPSGVALLGDGVLSMFVETPAWTPELTTSVDVDVSVTLGFGEITYTRDTVFTYVSNQLPTVVSIYPTDGPQTGGTSVSIRVVNFFAAGAGEGAINDVGVTFGTEDADVTAVFTDADGVTTISLTSPEIASVGDVSVDVVTLGGNDPKEASTEFTVFEVCDFQDFCLTTYSKDFDAEALVSNPPTSSDCVTTYCVDFPIVYNPVVSSFSPSLVSNAGGPRAGIVAVLADFPTVTVVGELSVSVDGVAATIASFSSSAAQTTVSIEFEPTTSAGMVEVVIGHVPSTTEASFEVELYAEPTGPPVVTTTTPAFGSTSESTSAIVVLANVSLLSLSDVSMSIGGEAVTVSNVLSPTVGEATVYFTLESGLCGLGETSCSKEILVEVAYTAVGDVRSTTFTFALEEPSPVITLVYPTSDIMDGGADVLIRVQYLPTDITAAELALTVIDVEGTRTPVESGSLTVSTNLVSGVTSLNFINPGVGVAGMGSLELDLVPASGEPLTAPFEQTLPVPYVTYCSSTSVVVDGSSSVTVHVRKLAMDTSNGYEVELCGSVLSSTGEITELFNGADSFGFTFTAPPCASLGDTDLTVSAGVGEGVTTAVKVVTYVAPEITFDVDFTSVEGGEPRVMRVWLLVADVGACTTADCGVTVLIGGVATTVTSVTLEEGTDYNLIGITTPVYAAGTADLVEGSVSVAQEGGVDERMFNLQYFVYPSVQYMTPGAGSTFGGVEVELGIDNFLTGFDVTELEFHLDGELVFYADTLVEAVGVTYVTFTPPAVDSPRDVVWDFQVTGQDTSVIPALQISYSYVVPDPEFLQSSVDRAAMSGGTEVEMDIKYLTPITDISEVTVQSGTNVNWEVVEVVYSDSQFTRLLLKSPVFETPTTESTVVQTATDNVFFDFTFFDSTLVVVTPPPSTTVLCGADEQKTFDVVVENFPEVTGTAALVVLFGPDVGVVVSNTYTYDATTSTTTVTVQAPVYDGEFVDGVADVGWSLFDVNDENNKVDGKFKFRTPVVAESAAFQSGYTKLDINFNQPTDGGSGGSSVLCNTVLDDASLLLLGLDASSTDCRWTTTSQLTIDYLSTATLLPGGVLGLKGGLGAEVENDVSTTMVAGDVTVQDTAVPILPVGQVDGPTTLGFCDDLVLDGSQSTGARLTYTWGCSSHSELDEIVATQTGASLTVVGDDFPEADATFDMTLKVTDMSGRSSVVVTFSVVRSSLPLPLLVFEGGNTQFVEPDADQHITASAEFSACGTAEELIFSWTLISSTSVVVGETIQKNSIFFPARTLESGGTYVYKVEAYGVSDPGSVVETELTIEVALLDLIARVGGGDRFLSETVDLELDGTGSNDPAGIYTLETLTLEWECMSSGLSCLNAQGTSLQLDSTPELTLAAGTLAPGVYLFTLEVSGGGRQDSMTVELTVVAAVIPTVCVSPDYEVMVNRAGRTVTADDKLAWKSIVTGVDAGTQLTYAWTVSPGGLDLTDKAVAPLGAAGTDFVLNEGLLQGGLRYTIVLTVTAPDGDGLASTFVDVNLPPSSGQCGISPETGVSLDTEFEVSCSGWVADDPSSSLKYAFEYELDGVVAVLRQAGKSNSLDGFQLSQGTVTVRVDVSDKFDSVTQVSMEVVVTDGFANKSAEEVNTELQNQVNDQVQSDLQKGDTTNANNNIRNIAGEANSNNGNANPNRITGGARRLVDNNLATDLYTSLVASIDTSMNAGNVYTFLGTVKTVAALSSQLSSDHYSDLMARLTQCSREVAGSVMTKSQTVDFLLGVQAMTNGDSFATVATDSGLTVAQQLVMLDGLSSEMTQILINIGHSYLLGEVLGEAATDLSGTAAGFSMTVVKMAEADALGATLETGTAGSFFTLPDVSLIAGSVDLVAWGNPQQWEANGQGLSFLTSKSYGMLLSSIGTGDVISLTDVVTDKEVLITMAVSGMRGGYAPVCVYWDSVENVWDSAGCSVEAGYTTSSVTCRCNRVSAQFAVVEEDTESSDNTAYLGFLLFLIFPVAWVARSAHVKRKRTIRMKAPPPPPAMETSPREEVLVPNFPGMATGMPTTPPRAEATLEDEPTMRSPEINLEMLPTPETGGPQSKMKTWTGDGGDIIDNDGGQGDFEL